MAYDLSSADICVHLTNQYQQKKHPLYTEKKEDTVRAGGGGGGGSGGHLCTVT